MKQVICLTLAAGLSLTNLFGQAPTSGKITYEGMRQIDRSQMRMVINGQEVRPRLDSPGSPDDPARQYRWLLYRQWLICDRAAG